MQYFLRIVFRRYFESSLSISSSEGLSCIVTHPFIFSILSGFPFLQLWQDPWPRQLPIRMECWQEVVQQNASHCAFFGSILPSTQLCTHTHTHARTQTTGLAQICFYFVACSDVLYLLECKTGIFSSNLAIKYVRLS